MAITRDGVTYDSPYGDVAGANEAFNKIVEQVGGAGGDSGAARQTILGQLKQAGDQFKSLYKNNIGRDATNDDLSKFFQGAGDALANPDTRSGQGLRNYTAQFIGDNFQQAAKDTATQKLSDLSGQAGTLADQYQEMGNKSLASLTDSLRSYQTSLFDKLRPQLNLAAQAGGFQDSGGQTLQEKGALTDLGNQADAILIPYGQSIQNNANAIRYGGMSAPYSLASSFAANQPNVAAGFGAGGLNFNDTNAMANFNQQRQIQLMNQQLLNASNYWTSSQPSFGSQILGTIARTPFQGSYSSGGGNLASSGGGGAAIGGAGGGTAAADLGAVA